MKGCLGVARLPFESLMKGMLGMTRRLRLTLMAIVAIGAGVTGVSQLSAAQDPGCCNNLWTLSQATGCEGEPDMKCWYVPETQKYQFAPCWSICPE